MDQNLTKTGRAKGGLARADVLTPEQRREIAQKAAIIRWGGSILRATHGSADHPLRIGDIEIPCYVLEGETRVLSQRGLQSGIGMSVGGKTGGAQRIAVFLEGLASKGMEVNDLIARIKNPLRFLPPHGGRSAYGYEATLLADICDVLLRARSAGILLESQFHIAERCELLVRGFARVGIIALIDEATGFQRDRARDALAAILEAFIAKELQPWIRTFPTDYYEQLFRLRGLKFPTDTVKRPQYFGHLTNDIVYRRLAPGVLEELKKVMPKYEKTGRNKAKLFQLLTTNVGYPKLREHLGSVVTIMKLSRDYQSFQQILDELHPAQGENMLLELTYTDDKEKDNGIGL